jgi:hypothetical protein
VQPPKAGTTQPVTVLFSKSLDHKSLQRFLTIEGAGAKAVAGVATTGKDEKSWSFTPTQPWGPQDYRLVVNGRLEDVAGNTPLRPFDMDLEAPAPSAQRLDISFRPTP